MPMDELIRAIGQVDAENIQDLVNAFIGRYRELYPQWDIVFFSLEKGEEEARRQKVEQILSFVREHGV